MLQHYKLNESLLCGVVLQKQMREYLVRLIYCEMLGHDASIGYIEAIKFAQQSNLLYKRVGKQQVCVPKRESKF